MSDGSTLDVEVAMAALGSIRSVEWLEGSGPAAGDWGAACDAGCRAVDVNGGIHYCFGAPLARPETQIALTQLAHRLENPRLFADPPPYRASLGLRGSRHLPVEIDGVNPV
ncbi:hypothetical protein [Streptomyces mirabilis]|uniref:hypothetical protein n=1 Tax=Streptomyces mirabilis TaxID=68239 RepID=UPI0036A9F17F